MDGVGGIPWNPGWREEEGFNRTLMEEDGFHGSQDGGREEVFLGALHGGRRGPLAPGKTQN